MRELINEAAKYIFFITLRQSLHFLPMRVMYGLGDMLGSIMVGEKREVIKDELSYLFPEMPHEEMKHILAKSMRNFRKDLFEIWTFPKMDQQKINRIARINGISHIEDALASKKGAILCLAHFGSWKIVLPALGYNGYSVNQIAADPMFFVGKNESAAHNRIMTYEKYCEQSLPARFIYVDGKMVHKNLYKALKNNEIVVAALDGVIGEGRSSQPFLGKEIRLSPGPLALAQRTGATPLAMFTVREKDDRHRIDIHPPFAVDDNDPEFILKWLKCFADLFAKYVSKHPDHYARFLYTIKKYPVKQGSGITPQEHRS